MDKGTEHSGRFSRNLGSGNVRNWVATGIELNSALHWALWAMVRLQDVSLSTVRASLSHVCLDIEQYIVSRRPRVHGPAGIEFNLSLSHLRLSLVELRSTEVMTTEVNTINTESSSETPGSQAQARRARQQQREAAKKGVPEANTRKGKPKQVPKPGFDHGLPSDHPDLPEAARKLLLRAPSPFLKRRRPPATPSKRPTPTTPSTQAPGSTHGVGNSENTDPSSSTASGPNQAGGDMDEVTEQGRQREAHRIQLLEANNPIESQSKGKKAQKERVPPERTFEITRSDMTPVDQDYLIPAGMLAKARRTEDVRRRQEKIPRLKLDSRLLRTGDWIVMAKDEDTKLWLSGFFNSDEFLENFKATIVADQANLKYAVRVHPPDSSEFTNEEILTHMFQDFENIGYVRVINESRSYKDKNGEVNKEYHKAIKKKLDFDDGGCPYIKTVWIRMSEDAQRQILENPDLLDLGIGSTEIELEKAKDKSKKAVKDKDKDKNQGENEHSSDEEMVRVIEQSSEGADNEEEPGNAAGTNGRE